MTKKNDLSSRVFGRLTVIGEAAKIKKKVAWLCQCSCGNRVVIRSCALVTGNTTSCGCRKIEKPNRLSHGQCRAKTKEYRAWQLMKRRCDWEKGPSWKNYGGRGIRVCKRWLNNFENFFTDVGPAPSPKHSIDRKKVNGHYTPRNVRWATAIEQANNKRR